MIDPPIVMYVSGSGRSGSTLLERILHATAAGAAVGELHCLWRLPFEDITCSCGQHARNDEYWRQILARAGIDAQERAELHRLEQIVARSGFIRRHRYSLSRLSAAPEVQQFLAIQFRLFEAIAELAGRRLIIDSSKAGPRAWIMACDPRVRLLHLYRRPTDVIASWRTRKFDQGLGGEMQRLSLSRAVADWLKSEHFARRLAPHKRIAMIDYEALCRDPRSVIDGALATLALPPSDARNWMGSHQVLPPSNYHSLNGNPDRFDRGTLTIRLRQTDWTRYERREAAAIRCLGGMLVRAYPPPRPGRT